MLLINNEIDLVKSFDKLKAAMNESRLIVKAESFGYMQAYLSLEKAVEDHINECSGEIQNTPAADPNDIKDIYI